MTDEVMNDMQAQLNNERINKLLDSKEYYESVRKIEEIFRRVKPIIPFHIQIVQFLNELGSNYEKSDVYYLQTLVKKLSSGLK